MSRVLGFACAVCFGNPDSPLGKGVTAGVSFLLAVVVFLLGFIVFTGFVWARRARQLERPL